MSLDPPSPAAATAAKPANPVSLQSLDFTNMSEDEQIAFAMQMSMQESRKFFLLQLGAQFSYHNLSKYSSISHFVGETAMVCIFGNLIIQQSKNCSHTYCLLILLDRELILRTKMHFRAIALV